MRVLLGPLFRTCLSHVSRFWDVDVLDVDRLSNVVTLVHRLISCRPYSSCYDHRYRDQYVLYIVSPVWSYLCLSLRLSNPKAYYYSRWCDIFSHMLLSCSLSHERYCDHCRFSRCVLSWMVVYCICVSCCGVWSFGVMTHRVSRRESAQSCRLMGVNKLWYSKSSFVCNVCLDCASNQLSTFSFKYMGVSISQYTILTIGAYVWCITRESYQFRVTCDTLFLRMFVYSEHICIDKSSRLLSFNSFNQRLYLHTELSTFSLLDLLIPFLVWLLRYEVRFSKCIFATRNLLRFDTSPTLIDSA